MKRGDIQSHEARVPTRTVIASIVGLWLCYFVVATARSLVMGIDFQGELFGLRIVVVVLGMIMTLGLWAVLRLFDRFSLAIRITAALLAALPFALATAQANQSIFAGVQERVVTAEAERRGIAVKRDGAGNLVLDLPGPGGAASRDPMPATIDRWQALVELALTRYYLLLTWCALYFALLAGERARTAEREAGEFRRAAKTAELRSLRYQVNPHFLFNTLNSLSALILTGKNDRAEAMVQKVAEFYRRSLTDDATADIALEREFALQETYLELEAVRFPDRLRTRFVLPADLREVRVPGMILQPLVENSVRYAVSPVARPVTISVEARAEYGRLVLSVADDGPGVADGAGHGFGIGLDNVRRRLATRFGDMAHIVSGPVEGGYATHIRIPLNGGGEE